MEGGREGERESMGSANLIHNIMAHKSCKTTEFKIITRYVFTSLRYRPILLKVFDNRLSLSPYTYMYTSR